jgi:pSer/pThr/pTyr-binding forkhead associated (FHA) protein
MSSQDQLHKALEPKDVRINELMAALRDAERKFREQEALIADATEHTAETRRQYSQAVERADILRRRLDDKEDQLNALRAQIDASHAELKAARESVTERDQKIASLEQAAVLYEKIDSNTPKRLSIEQDDVLKSIDQTNNEAVSTNPAVLLTLLGFALESLDQPEIIHRVRKAVTTIGRITTNDFVINSKSVSRRHARLVVQHEGIWLIDMQSSNGCSVNGQAISGHLLRDGDTVVIGESRFKFVVSRLSLEAEQQAGDETLPLLDESIFLYAMPKANLEISQD